MKLGATALQKFLVTREASLFATCLQGHTGTELRMIWLNTRKSDSNNLFATHHILETGQMSRQEHQRLMTVLLSDRSLGEGDRRQINQIFDALQRGKVRLI